MLKYDINKVAKQPAWVFSCKFAAYFRNTFYYEHLWGAASVFLSITISDASSSSPE